MSDMPSKQVFDSFLNKSFTVSLNDQNVSLDLAEVASPERSPAQFECFTLIFKGDEKTFLEQGIYRFEAEDFQAIDLFLVPVAGDQTGYDYEVVINRRIEA